MNTFKGLYFDVLLCTLLFSNLFKTTTMTHFQRIDLLKNKDNGFMKQTKKKNIISKHIRLKIKFFNQVLFSIFNIFFKFFSLENKRSYPLKFEFSILRNLPKNIHGSAGVKHKPELAVILGLAKINFLSVPDRKERIKPAY